MSFCIIWKKTIRFHSCKVPWWFDTFPYCSSAVFAYDNPHTEYCITAMKVT